MNGERLFLDTSFVVMQDQRLSDAVTTDVHFQQAGFRTLLLEEA
jgi:hypothetical protein